MALNTKTSVVDYMKSKGLDSSYSNRSKLANQYGIKGYQGTASQNINLMSKIKTGAAAPKPAAKPPAKPATPAPGATAPAPKPAAPPPANTPVSPVAPPATPEATLTEDQIQQMIDQQNKGWQNQMTGMFGNMTDYMTGLMGGMQPQQGQAGTEYEQMFGDMKKQYEALMQQVQYFQVLQQYYNMYGGQGGGQAKTSPFM